MLLFVVSGWTTDGSEKTQYPAQVQIRVRLRCHPLLEERCKPRAPEMKYSNHSSGKLGIDDVYFDENKVADERFKLSTSKVERFSQSSGKSDSTDFAPFDSLETHVDATTST